MRLLDDPAARRAFANRPMHLQRVHTMAAYMRAKDPDRPFERSVVFSKSTHQGGKPHQRFCVGSARVTGMRCSQCPSRLVS